MNYMIKSLCLIGSIALVGCSSSSSDSTTAGAADLQGRWATPCVADIDDNTSSRVILNSSGATFVYANTQFLNSIACDGSLFRSVNEHYTYSLTGEETELAAGNAKNVDVTFEHGSFAGSPDYIDALAAMGTTLQDVVLASQGIDAPDLSNVTPEEFNWTNPLVDYTIYRIDTKADGVLELRTGSTSQDTSTPELRATRLSTTRRFDKLP